MEQFNSDINIYFTGFMASGKTKIGSAVANRLGREFVDSDELIAQKDGRSCKQIFTESGEEYFRKLELEIIIKISKNKKQVISLGGGAVTNPKVLDIVRNTGILIKLWAPIDILVDRIMRRDTRPIMQDLTEEECRQKVIELQNQRKEAYDKADFSIKSDESIPLKHICSSIIKKLSVWELRRLVVEPTSGKPYPIFIGKNFLKKIDAILSELAENVDFLMAVDSNVAEKQRENMLAIRKASQSRIFKFPAGEENKNLTTLNRLYNYMLKRGYSRKTMLLQFGGGIVGDMAGFGAATYQRGIPFIQIPTTLLAMVDSSVGGKVAVNHPLGKNMIGAFYQPLAVVVDTSVLDTLPYNEFLAGMAEVIKYGVISDSEFFKYLEVNCKSILNKDADELEYIIKKCCTIKAAIVKIDEKEQGIRAILNFGHTFGHAIENLTEYKKFSHGIAISLGMRVAARLTTLMKLWPSENEDRLNKLLNDYGFPTHFKINPKDAWKAMSVDKKVEHSNRIYILPESIGKANKVSNAPEELVHQAWAAIQE